jgi:hypothetical protein
LLAHNAMTTAERGMSNIVNDVSTNLNIPPDPRPLDCQSGILMSFINDSV